MASWAPVFVFGVASMLLIGAHAGEHDNIVEFSGASEVSFEVDDYSITEGQDWRFPHS